MEAFVKSILVVWTPTTDGGTVPAGIPRTLHPEAGRDGVILAPVTIHLSRCSHTFAGTTYASWPRATEGLITKSIWTSWLGSLLDLLSEGMTVAELPTTVAKLPQFEFPMPNPGSVSGRSVVTSSMYDLDQLFSCFDRTQQPTVK